MRGQKANRKQLAAILGVELTTIDSYINRGMPYVQRADRAKGIQWEFNTAEVFKWFKQQTSSNDDSYKVELAEAQRRKAVAEAEIQELSLRKLRGELVEIGTVEKAGIDCYMACKSRLLVIPVKLAPMLAIETDASAIKETLKSEIYQALHELGSYEPEDLDEIVDPELEGSPTSPT